MTTSIFALPAIAAPIEYVDDVHLASTDDYRGIQSLGIYTPSVGADSVLVLALTADYGSATVAAWFGGRPMTVLSGSDNRAALFYLKDPGTAEGELQLQLSGYAGPSGTGGTLISYGLLTNVDTRVEPELIGSFRVNSKTLIAETTVDFHPADYVMLASSVDHRSSFYGFEECNYSVGLKELNFYRDDGTGTYSAGIAGGLPRQRGRYIPALTYADGNRDTGSNGTRTAVALVFSELGADPDQAAYVAPDGPGFPNVARTAGELLTRWDHSADHDDRLVASGFHRGYLWFASRVNEEGRGIGQSAAVSVHDISNPTLPVEVNRLYLRDGSGSDGAPHSYHVYGGDLHVWNPRIYGFYDFSDMLDIQKVSSAPYDFRWVDGGAEVFKFPYQLHGQYGYQFSTITVVENGEAIQVQPEEPIQLRDATDSHRLVGQVDPYNAGGVDGSPGNIRGHSVTVGNLIIATSALNSSGARTVIVYDASDPTDIREVRRIATTLPQFHAYEPAIWKNYIVYGAMQNQNGRNSELVFIDFTGVIPPKVLQGQTQIRGARYMQFQDEFLFAGNAKIDLSPLDNNQTPTIERTFVSDAEASARQSEYILPLGNLAVMGENNTVDVGTPGGRVHIYAHQGPADTRPPEVYFSSPAHGEVDVAVTSSIGVVIPETLNTLTVNSDTIFLREANGTVVPGTLTLSDKDIINFVPSVTLKESTTYEFVLAAEGVRDAAGNGIELTRIEFTTGLEVRDVPEITSFRADSYPLNPGVETSFTVSATSSEGGTLDYRLNPDGQGYTDWTTTPTFAHTYNEAGRYLATLQVRVGSIITGTATQVTVVNTAPTQGPTASAPLAFAGADDVWTVNPDNDSVTRVAVTGPEDQTVLEVATGANPESLAVDRDGRIWVVCQDDDRIEIYDPDGSLYDSVEFAYGSAPYGIAFLPGGNFCYVTLEGSGELAKIALNTRDLVAAPLALGPTPRAIAIVPSGGHVLVTRFISAENHGEVWVVRHSSFELLDTIVLEKDAISADTEGSGQGVPNYVNGITISPDGTEAWVSAKKDNTDRGPLRSGDDLNPVNTVRAIAIPIDLSNLAAIPDPAAADYVDIDNGALPTGLGFSPFGDYLFVAMQGTNSIHFFDRLAGDRSGSNFGVGLAPTAVVLDARNDHLVTKNFLSRTLSISDASSFLETGAGMGVARTIPTVGSEQLSTAVLRGKQVFYNSIDPRMAQEEANYMSCATCHLDGGHDGRVWDFTQFGEGLRNTTDLRGTGGTAHGRLHWTGNFDEIQDFDAQIRALSGGTGFIDGTPHEPLSASSNAGRDTDLDAMATYLASLQSVPKSPHRASDGAMTADAIMGRSHYFEMGCAECHGGDQFTNSNLNVLQDVRSWRSSSGSRLGAPNTSVDTPTLKGIWDTGPYLHDGRASSLDDLLADAALFDGASGEQVHAVPEFMRPELIAYLLQLDAGSVGQVGGPVVQRSFGNGGAPRLITQRIEAEHYDVGGAGVAYSDQSGRSGGLADFRARADRSVEVQPVSDGDDTSLNVGWVNNGEWLEYTVEVAEEGLYAIDLRAASPGSGLIRVHIDGQSHDSATIYTGNFQAWDTERVPGFQLEPGVYVVRIEALTGSYNLNWFQFARTGDWLRKRFADYMANYPSLVGGNTAASADPDGDSIVNALEQLLALDPTRFDNAPLVAIVESSQLASIRFHYDPEVEDASIALETTTDLLKWDPVTLPPEWLTAEGDLMRVDGDWSLVDDGHRFFRLRAVDAEGE